MCRVYEDRPLMCRSFPVRMGVNGLRFVPGCKAVLNMMRRQKTMDGQSPEVRVAIELAERLLEFNRSLEDDEQKWRYNLVSDRWEPMNR